MGDLGRGGPCSALASGVDHGETCSTGRWRSEVSPDDRAGVVAVAGFKDGRPAVVNVADDHQAAGEKQPTSPAKGARTRCSPAPRHGFLRARRSPGLKPPHGGFCVPPCVPQRRPNHVIFSDPT